VAPFVRHFIFVGFMDLGLSGKFALGYYEAVGFFIVGAPFSPPKRLNQGPGRGKGRPYAVVTLRTDCRCV